LRVVFFAWTLAALRGRATFTALAGGFRGVVRFATRARAAGFREVLAVFAADLRLGGVRFRPAVFLPAARPLVAVFRPPLRFLPVVPARCRRARAAFRLAMGRPFTPLHLP
jgi:hypothetical protein